MPCNDDKPMFLFYILDFEEIEKTEQIEYTIRLNTRYLGECTANNVEIIIPLPSLSHCHDQHQIPEFKRSPGNYKFLTEENAIRWKFVQN